jgi:hypothetical protein
MIVAAWRRGKESHDRYRRSEWRKVMIVAEAEKG